MAPANLISMHVAHCRTTALVDTGAVKSVISESFYNRLMRQHRNQVKVIEAVNGSNDLETANGSVLHVSVVIEADVNIGGVVQCNQFVVARNLIHHVIIGMDILRSTKAVVDIKNNLLILFDGLTAVPMTRAGDTVLVKSNRSFLIPAYSESLITVNCVQKLVKGTYVIENDARAPCQSLMVARTLIDSQQKVYPCRVMNTTDRPIKLKSKTIIGSLSAVRIEKMNEVIQPKQSFKKTIAEKRAELEAKSISLTDTALKGSDLDLLIDMLYENIDLFATKLTELPGCDLLKHKIETGDNPPVNKRSYRMSPEDKIEVNKQVDEMLAAGIIIESDTPYSSPIVLVKKKNGEKRFVVDYRALNAQTVLTSWPLPVFEDVVDVLATQKPTLWTALDLKSGYWQAALDPETAHKTGFKTDNQGLCFQRLAMGLSGSCQFFQMLMQKCLKGLTPNTVLVYLDDLLVMGQNPKDMIAKIGQVFDRFRSANLRMHPSKCHWAVDRVQFLGHVLDKEEFMSMKTKSKL